MGNSKVWQSLLDLTTRGHVATICTERTENSYTLLFPAALPSPPAVAEVELRVVAEVDGPGDDYYKISFTWNYVEKELRYFVCKNASEDLDKRIAIYAARVMKHLEILNYGEPLALTPPSKELVPSATMRPARGSFTKGDRELEARIGTDSSDPAGRRKLVYATEAYLNDWAAKLLR